MSNFKRVAVMNTAFGNPAGTQQVSLSRIRKQSMNIPDEVGELFIALGADQAITKAAVAQLKWCLQNPTGPVNLEQIRDSLADVHVFTYGVNHLMNIDADADMDVVLDGVMTRFVKNKEDLDATIIKHGANGITQVYIEGEYPTKVVKSAVDQPDAPKGKFLKSASYKEPMFAPVDLVFVD